MKEGHKKLKYGEHKAPTGGVTQLIKKNLILKLK